MASTSIKFSELYTIHEALALIGQGPTPIAYAVAKNLKTIGRIIDDAQTLAREFVESRFDDGNVLYMVVNQAGERLRPWTDGETLGKDEARAYDLSAEQKAEVDAYHKTVNEALHDVHLHIIPANKLEGLNLPANALVPLIGTIIIETDS